MRAVMHISLNYLAYSVVSFFATTLSALMMGGWERRLLRVTFSAQLASMSHETSVP